MYISASQSRNTNYNPINPAQFRLSPIQQQQPQQSLYPSALVMVNDISYGRHHHHESGQTTLDFSNNGLGIILSVHEIEIMKVNHTITATWLYIYRLSCTTTVDQWCCGYSCWIYLSTRWIFLWRGTTRSIDSAKSTG